MYIYTQTDIVTEYALQQQILVKRPQGYKTDFMLNSAETEICIKLVNNYPMDMTKNKLVYHTRISKLVKWRGSTEAFHHFINSFIIGHWVVIYL